ncbi:MAG: ABC transporter permease [Pseudoclavibacter sp.]
MWKYILTRLGIALPTLLIIMVLTFLTVQLIPGDPAVAILGDTASQEQLEAVREELGLNLPLWQQFGVWFLQAIQGDLGHSLTTGQVVSESILQRSVVTITLATVAVLVTATVGIVLGVWGSLRGGWADRFVLFTTSVADSIPNFWAGVVLVFVFAVALGVLPANGWVPFDVDPSMWARSLVLPVVALSLASVATVARQTRAAFSEVSKRDFVRSLRASGLSLPKIIFKHILRNAAIPIVTVLGLQFVLLLGGAIVIEEVFTLPGIGQLAINAVETKDVPMIQGVVLFTAIMVLVVNFTLDIVFAWLNPKVRL